MYGVQILIHDVLWAAIIRIELQYIHFIYMEKRINMSAQHGLKSQSTKEQQKIHINKTYTIKKEKTKKFLVHAFFGA